MPREFWLIKYDYREDAFETYIDKSRAKSRYEACGEYFPAQLIHVREVLITDPMARSNSQETEKE